MPHLSWISDADLKVAVSKLIAKAQDAAKKAPTKLHKNVIDPFSAMFQMAGFNLTSDEYLKSEITRQGQKSYQNHVGIFHQNILGCVANWKDLGVGNVMDLVNDERKIIAEVKNKHNTVTGSKLVDVYTLLEAEVMPKASRHHGYTAYFANIIPLKPSRVDKPFAPSDNKTSTLKPLNEKIRVIDGASFYALVTGYENALQDLFAVLPSIINEELMKTQIDDLDIQFLYEFYNRAYGK